jgi:hypothetical protein
MPLSRDLHREDRRDAPPQEGDDGDSESNDTLEFTKDNPDRNGRVDVHSRVNASFRKSDSERSFTSSR